MKAHVVVFAVRDYVIEACRLKKLLFEENGFSPEQRARVLAGDTQLKQWQISVDESFRKHHNIRRAELDARVLGVGHDARRRALQAALDDDLRIVIEIRNKLAHGQWIYPFNNEGTAVEPEKYRLINKENLQSLQFKYAILHYLSDTIHDLVVSPQTFERDFDLHFRNLQQAQTNLKTKSYAKYAESLRASRAKARANRLTAQ